ncbi:E3 SUMO-protein ligase ZBED1-like [Tachysurus ichikawai]
MTKTVCKLCHTVIAYCGNTTDLSAHLARHHPELNFGLNAKQPASSQQTLDVTLSKLPCTSEKAKCITESIALFIRPYSVVENAGFRNMIHTLEPSKENKDKDRELMGFGKQGSAFDWLYDSEAEDLIGFK